MYKTETDGRESNGFVETPAFRWSMLFTGLAVAFLGMDIMVRRPMMKELATVRSNLAAVEQDMEELVGVRNQVWETNNLLTSLKSQYRHLEDARLSMTAIKELRKEIDEESKRTASTFASLDRLVAVQNTVLKNTGNVQSAQNNLDRMVAMQQQVVSAGEHTTDAVDAVHDLIKVRETARMGRVGVDEAMASVEELAELKSRVLVDAEGVEFAQTEVDRIFETVRTFGDLRLEILTSGKDVDAAQKSLFELIALKDEVFAGSKNTQVAHDAAQELIALKDEINLNSTEIATAQDSAGELITLKDTIAQKGGNTKVAFENTGKLFGLRDTLNSNMDLDGANQNLETLVQIQNDLNSQGRDVTEALDTLEVLTSLSDELQQQVDSIGGMRKSLLDIVLMESTVARAVQVVKPLTELSDLRRMSDKEVREAAKTIVETRTARREQNRRTASESLKLDDVTLFGAEPTQDVLVPQPRDLEDILD